MEARERHRRQAISSLEYDVSMQIATVIRRGRELICNKSRKIAGVIKRLGRANCVSPRVFGDLIHEVRINAAIANFGECIPKEGGKRSDSFGDAFEILIFRRIQIVQPLHMVESRKL